MGGIDVGADFTGVDEPLDDAEETLLIGVGLVEPAARESGPEVGRDVPRAGAGLELVLRVDAVVNDGDGPVAGCGEVADGRKAADDWVERQLDPGIGGPVRGDMQSTHTASFWRGGHDKTICVPLLEPRGRGVVISAGGLCNDVDLRGPHKYARLGAGLVELEVRPALLSAYTMSVGCGSKARPKPASDLPARSRRSCPCLARPALCPPTCQLQSRSGPQSARRRRRPRP